MQRHFGRLVRTTLALTFIVIVLGAYVRLSDAGLGCPDWPGCYGELTPLHAKDRIDAAERMQPGGPVSLPKAWKEMIHRYLAGTLGLAVLTIAVVAWRGRRMLAPSPVLPGVLLGVVILQALLGMWTVTLLLKPFIVTAHLLGGMSTFALLVWLALRQSRTHFMPERPRHPLRRWAAFGLLLVAMQIVLGGWVSSNYAALACPDLPMCQGEWIPPMDFRLGFHLHRELGMTPDGEMLPLAALTAIHWTHRVGAVIVFFVVGGIGLALLRTPALRGLAVAVLGMLLVQVSLGIANVAFFLPLPLAVMHNAGAALLLALMVALNLRLAAADLWETDRVPNLRMHGLPRV